MQKINLNLRAARLPYLYVKSLLQQECIPVGWVPLASVAISPATHCPLLPTTHAPLAVHALACQVPSCHTHPLSSMSPSCHAHRTSPPPTMNDPLKQKEWHTLVKTLPFPTLHLQVVIMKRNMNPICPCLQGGAEGSYRYIESRSIKSVICSKMLSIHITFCFITTLFLGCAGSHPSVRLLDYHWHGVISCLKWIVYSAKLSTPDGVFPKWSRTFIEFREFRESDKPLKHELGWI